MLTYGVIARGCGHSHGAIWRYFGYVALFVWLPGFFVLRTCLRRKITVLDSIGFGLPVGFAVEVLVYLGLASLDARALYAWTPVIWGVGAVHALTRNPLRRSDLIDNVVRSRWVLCALGGLFLALTVTAASQYYAAAPLLNGRLMDGTNCDWVYLISRATEIRVRWPLEDPSMAGQPLSYHYFLMVHLAASSSVTGVTLSTLLLRLVVVPMHAALLIQAFLLGRKVSKAAWGGVLAALLLLFADEVSFHAAAHTSTFFDLFVRWLYVSPTFFFGVVFMGALLLLVYEVATSARVRVSHYLLLAGVAAAATGAKGTVVPPLLAGMGVWILIETVRKRAIAWQMLGILAALTFGFGVVYAAILMQWGTGTAKIVPFASMHLSQFWLQHVDAWTRALTNVGLGAGVATVGAQLGAAAVIFTGYHGVRLLALPYFFHRSRQAEPQLVLWLGLVYGAGLLLGQLLHLDSHSQLYFLFPTRIAAAVLAAAAGVAYWPDCVRWYESLGEKRETFATWALALICGGIFIALVWAGEMVWWVAGIVCCVVLMIAAPRRSPACAVGTKAAATFSWRMLPRVGLCLAVLTMLLVQVNHWRLRNRQGFSHWLVNSSTAPQANLAKLREGLRWIRDNTSRDAVIIANAFTPKNVRPDHLAQIDGTTVDKYFYYSAFCERRCWVEGPSYLRDQPEAERRMRTSAQLFYEANTSSALADIPAGDFYVLIDRALKDGAQFRFANQEPLFSNERVAIYHLPAARNVSVAKNAIQAQRALAPTSLETTDLVTR
jgi:hypothetical protein